MQDDRHCANCANWLPAATPAQQGAGITDNARGECHRYAPRPLVVEKSTVSTGATVWPMTHSDDVCGEWYFGGRGAAARRPETDAESAGQPPLVPDALALK